MNEAIADLAYKTYSVLLPFSWIALMIVIFVLVPMAFFQNTRGPSGLGPFFASWLFGITVWMLSAAVTFTTFGWIGLIIGLIFFGIGVVPIGLFAAIFVIKSFSLSITLIVMLIVVFASRAGSVILMEEAPKD